tara:strand:- start:1140 stop:1610 length:471 start_codon:yes stop_codon:yes gene_type:complete
MILDFYPVLMAFSWSGIFWALGGCLIAFLALLMIIAIVFLQDSKDGGLGGAFGSAGGGGDALLGAGGQKGIVKITALISLIFTVLVIGWGMVDMSGAGGGASVEPVNEDAILNPPSPTTGTGVIPGLSPGGGSLLPAPGGAGTAGGAGGSSDGGNK